MKTTRIPGLHYSSIYQPDRRIDFNGWFWERAGGNVLIDPMPLTNADLDFVRERGGAKWILVNNAEHLRAAPDLAEALDARVLAPATERDRLSAHAESIGAWFEGGSDLPDGLSEDVEVFPLRGGKSPIEPCFFLRPIEALYFGDLVRCHETGTLRLLPEPKIADRDEVVRTLRALPNIEPQAILLGDGDPILNGAAEAWRALLAAL